MKLWPLLLRELRAASRQRQIYFLRSYSAGAAVLALFLLLANNAGIIGSFLGIRIFQTLNFTLFFIIATGCPLLTAECISQERRDGTLGLLFLTPLSSADIIISKLVSHGLLAVMLVAAVMPMMILPMVFGGVPGRILLQSLIVHACTLAVALCAGMLASTRSVTSIKSIVLAEIFSALFLILLALLHPFVRLIMAPVICLLVVKHCSQTLRAKWQDPSGEFSPARWEKALSMSEWARGFFRWNTAAALDRNPIAWLQEYSWTGRLAKWAWMFFVLSGLIYCLIVLDERDHAQGYFALGMALALGLSFSATNSFRTERQSGALELLLVTPLKNSYLVLGRAWGLWVHFFPAVTAFFVIWVLSPENRHLHLPHSFFSFWILGSYLFVPLIGLLLSLFPMHLLMAWLATFTFGILAPYAIAMTIHRQGSPGAFPILPMIALIIQGSAGLGAFFLALDKLKMRRFAFHGS